MRAEHQRAFDAADLSLAEVGESASTPVGARIAALPHEDAGGQDALAGELAKEGPRMLGPLLHALGALGDPPLDAPRSLSEVDEGTFMAAFVTLERARSDPDRYVQETAERVLREHRPTPPRP